MDERIRWQQETGDLFAEQLRKSSDELTGCESEIQQVLRRLYTICPPNSPLMYAMENKLKELSRRTEELVDRLEGLSRAVMHTNETFASVERQMSEYAKSLMITADSTEEMQRSTLKTGIPLAFDSALPSAYACPLWLFDDGQPGGYQQLTRIELSPEVTFVPEPMPIELSRFQV